MNGTYIFRAFDLLRSQGSDDLRHWPPVREGLQVTGFVRQPVTGANACADCRCPCSLPRPAVWPARARRSEASARPSEPAFRQVGVASWYGPGFHGKRTASGERFDQNDLTAAHRKLPLGSEVKVTNLENGRSIVVEINDRGPYVKGRVIDLSKAAARRLGIVEDGVPRCASRPRVSNWRHADR